MPVRDRAPFIFLLGLPSAWLLLLFTVPLAIVWIYSFLSSGPQGQVVLDFTLANYVRALEWIHLGIIWKSVWISALATAVCFAIGFPLAMGIAFSPERYKNVLLLLVILPFWTNMLIRTYAWISILRTSGFLNFGLEWMHEQLSVLLGFMGFADVLGAFEPLRLLYNQPAVAIGLVYVHLPFMVLPIYATLERMNKSYLEASLDLGASHWRTVLSVTLPLALAGVASGCFLVFMLSLGNFVIPDLLGGPRSEMIGNLIARQFGPGRDWPFGSALSFIILYTTFVLLWIRANLARRRAESA